MRKIHALFASFLLIIAGCSTDSNTGTTTVIPLAPSNLTATVISTTQVNLAWTDNSTNESGYKVERKILGSNFAQVGTTGENIASFSDLNLTPNTTYVYRVVAYNSAGNSLQYSNEDTVVTTINPMPPSLNNGLFAYYPFSGNAGDSSGNGNHGTVNGATLANDRFSSPNNSYNFNGTSNYITLPIGFPGGNSPKSFAIWINAQNGSYNFIIDGGTSVNSRSFGLFWNINASVNKLTFHGDGATFDYEFADISFNTWNHVVVCYDGSEVKAYLNGLYVGSKSMVLNTTQTSFINIACRNNYSAFFAGKIDDVRLYNRTLTQSEITYLATH